MKTNEHETVYPNLTRYKVSRASLTGGILDRMARDLAEDIAKHHLTEREVHCLAANLAEEAIHYAAKIEAEEQEAKVAALQAAREERNNSLPSGYSVSKSDGRVGWQWKCPKGFNHYNFPTEKAAMEDALQAARAERRAGE